MSQTAWYLEGYFDQQGVLSRLLLSHFPFYIGRQVGLDFQVPSNSVSRVHAIIQRAASGQLSIHDQGSTNGTFVNHQRLESQARIGHGDVLHFADFEVRLIQISEENRPLELDDTKTVMGVRSLSNLLPTGIRELQELLEQKLVIPAFQPIIELQHDSIHAYEILGRGRHPSLSPNPGPLFRIADSMSGMALRLSNLFRDVGIAQAAAFQTHAKFFFNVHPDELKNQTQLLKQMETLRANYEKLPLVLEISEQSVTSLDEVKYLKSALAQLDIELAFDDFGAGQARMLELVDAPAHYLKFDINMMRDIDTASPGRQEMISTLVALAKKMGIGTLAEGIEKPGELAFCREFGFDYVQGFIFGRPTEGSLG